MTIFSKKKSFLNRSVLRIYLYPFVLANIIVCLSAYLFQYLMEYTLIFSFSAGIIYILMFCFMIKQHKAIMGHSISKKTLIALFVLILLLGLSLVGQIVQYHTD